MWSDHENETLIHYHSKAKENRKMYYRAGSFHNSLYSFFGLISVLASTVATTMSWSTDENSENDSMMLSSITTLTALTTAIQNFYKFKENSNNFTEISKSYARIQNKIESVGNIHPEYRPIKPDVFFKMIGEKFNLLSDSRVELSSILKTSLYSKKKDKESYLLRIPKFRTNDKKINLQKMACSRRYFSNSDDLKYLKFSLVSNYISLCFHQHH